MPRAVTKRLMQPGNITKAYDMKADTDGSVDWDDHLAACIALEPIYVQQSDMTKLQCCGYQDGICKTRSWRSTWGAVRCPRSCRHAHRKWWGWRPQGSREAFVFQRSLVT